jgi:hypothetical protein
MEKEQGSNGAEPISIRPSSTISTQPRNLLEEELQPDTGAQITSEPPILPLPTIASQISERVEIRELLESPTDYHKDLISVDGVASDIQVFKSPPWLSFVLICEESKVFVRGPAHDVLIRITPSTIQRLQTNLSSSTIRVRGVFYAEASPETTSLAPAIVAEEIAIVEGENARVFWSLP